MQYTYLNLETFMDEPDHTVEMKGERFLKREYVMKALHSINDAIERNKEARIQEDLHKTCERKINREKELAGREEER